MALGPRLELRQTQSLVMTPQLQQAIKLLALSNLEVETFIGEAVDANPLLELGETADTPDGDLSPPPAEERRTSLESSPIDQLIGEGRAADDRPLDIDPAAFDDGEAAGSSPEPGWSGEFTGGSGAEHRSVEDRGGPPPTLVQHLEAQLGTIAGSPRMVAIVRHLVGLIDETGYLTIPLEDVADALDLAPGEADAGLALLQSLDPCGVGARSLGECIALQAREANRYDPAMACLIKHLALIARGELVRLKRLCEVDDEDFAEMLTELRGYDPKPGLRFGVEAGTPVTPDILITPGAAGWNIALNQATLPRLVVNRSYYVELRGACDDRSSRGWLAEKLADANWLLKTLDQRQKTILKVASEIVRQQDGFFRGGVAQLKPLTLLTVAEAVGLHESTISRVTSNKYLNCARGTFELKYFFTSGVAASQGEGSVSAEAVKLSIRQLIDDEAAETVLSDDAMVELLRARGFELARRTVAKYREAIGLGSSVQRRRQKAFAAIR